MKAADFYTVPKSEAGVRLPLKLPNGADSDQWLLVVGPDSKVYADAAAALNRHIAELAQVKDPAEKDLVANTHLLDFASALVIGWSFEDEFSDEALRAFLTNAPMIAAAVRGVAHDRERFFGLA